MQQWREKTNRSQQVQATIMASLFNLFRKESIPARSPEDYLPFQPPPKYLSEAESEAALDLFFGGIVARNGDNHG